MTISFTRSINTVSGIALAMCLLSGAGSFTSKNETLKNIFNTTAVAFGAIAFVNKLTGSYYEQVASNKGQDKLNKLNNQLSKAEETANSLKDNDEFLTQIRTKNESKILELEQELESINYTFTGLNSELTLKTQSLNHINEINSQKLEQLIKDNNLRIKKVYHKLLSKLIDLTQSRIDSNYHSIHSLVDKEVSRLSTLLEDNPDNQDFIDIKKSLEKFQKTLSDSENKHDDQVEDLRKMLNIDDLTDETIIANLNIASEIFDSTSLDLANLKVKMRNCLNIANVKNLKFALEELETEKSNHQTNYKAIGKYRQLMEDTNQMFDQLEEKVVTQRDNAVESIDNALAKIQEVRETNMTLNQRLVELSKPQTWEPATRTDLRMGNVIIKYFAKYGYTLDRHSTDYEGWRGTVYLNPSRSKKRVLVSDLKEHSEYLQQLCKSFAFPKFEYDPGNDLILCHLQYAQPPEGRKLSPVEKVQEFLVDSNSLIDFVTESYHIGFWGETGTGKSTAISNTIGGMIQALGGNPIIKTTIPKIDKDTAKLFPKGFINWLGIPNSVFGLLEAALEIQYRIHVNEQKYLEGEDITDFDPILFFIDEINTIIRRWGSVSKDDLANVLLRFEETLEGGRLEYFQTHMKLELFNYPHQFAKSLLLFIWQTGRSLRVKSLIAGQNLQPGSLGLKKNDIANCSYITLGNGILSAIPYKVKKHQLEVIESQYKLIQSAYKDDSNLQYTGLFTPSKGDAYFAILPPPNYYHWDINTLGTINRNLKEVKKSIEYQDNLEIDADYAEECTDNFESYYGNQIRDNITNFGYQGNIEGTSGTYGTSLESSYRATWAKVPDLPNEYKTLDYEGGMEFFMNLPKKSDGSIHKTKAYQTVFKVANKRNRKPLSEFMDLLQAEFGL